VIKIASRKSVCKYDLTINELSFSCAMGFVRTFMSHYSQVLQILERFNGDLTRREVQANTYAMAKINSSWLSSRSSASFCVQLHQRPSRALTQCFLFPLIKFYIEQIFVLVRMQLRKYVDI